MPDIESGIARLKVPAGEMAILAAHANIVGIIEPGEFDADRHLPMLTHILKNVHPAIEPGTRFHLNRAQKGRPGGLFSRIGLTDKGANIPIPERRQKRKASLLMGEIHAIGLGNYIIEKTRQKYNLLSLSFRPMMDYAAEKIDTELSRPYRIPFYDPKGLDPVLFAKAIPVNFWLLTHYRPQIIWQNDAYPNK